MRSAQKDPSAARHDALPLSRQDDWEPKWGLPVNQEDLVGTLLSFSVAIPRGLACLGVNLPTEDRDAFFHIWRVIGHILGCGRAAQPRQVRRWLRAVRHHPRPPAGTLRGRHRPHQGCAQPGSVLNFGASTAGDAVPVAADLAGKLGMVVFKQGLLITNKGRRYEWQVPTGLTETS